MTKAKLQSTLPFALLAALAVPNACFGQAVHDYGTWFSVNTTGALAFHSEKDTKLKWWFDGHMRLFDDAGGYGQSIVRPGVGYQLNDRFTAWIGYGWINETPVSGSPNFDENRIFQQLTWGRDIGCWNLSTRTRLEQRFVETGQDTGWRARHFTKAIRPLCIDPRLSAVVWDEFFFDLNSTDWGQNASFSQNRLFLGLGWTFDRPRKPRIEIGYLQQFIRKRGGDDRINHILSINWFTNF